MRMLPRQYPDPASTGIKKDHVLNADLLCNHANFGIFTTLTDASGTTPPLPSSSKPAPRPAKQH